MVHAAEILDIIELVYYVPALLCSLYVVKKQGFSRETGWIFLTIISLCRIIGSSTGIAAIYQPTNSSLVEASVITSSIGSATLVAAFTAIVNRINYGTGIKALSPRMTRFLQLLSLAAVALGIVGGIDQSSSDPSKRSSGQTYTKIAVIFILVQFLASSFIAFHAALNTSHVLKDDKKLMWTSLAAMPFLLVRVIYSICSAFDPESSVFSMLSNTTTAVIVRAFMAIAMEFVVVTLFLLGGFLSPKWIKPSAADAAGNGSDDFVKPQQYQQGYQYQQQQTGTDRYTAV